MQNPFVCPQRLEAAQQKITELEQQVKEVSDFIKGVEVGNLNAVMSESLT